MEDLLDNLGNLVPLVIVIASFLLPAFLRKKKSGSLQQPGDQQPGDQPKKPGRPAAAGLEEKVRRFFEEAKESTQKPKKAPDVFELDVDESAAPKGLAPGQPRRPRPGPQPARGKPAAPSARMPTPMAPTPTVSSAEDAVPRPARSLSSELSPKLESFEEIGSTRAKEDAYSIDREAYEVDTNAFAIDEDVHVASTAPDLSPATGAQREITSIGKKPLSSLYGDEPAAPRQPGRTEVAAEIGAQEGFGFLTSGNWEAIRNAIIIKEILDRPLALRDPSQSTFW